MTPNPAKHYTAEGQGYSLHEEYVTSLCTRLIGSPATTTAATTPPLATLPTTVHIISNNINILIMSRVVANKAIQTNMQKFTEVVVVVNNRHRHDQLPLDRLVRLIIIVFIAGTIVSQVGEIEHDHGDDRSSLCINMIRVS